MTRKELYRAEVEAAKRMSTTELRSLTSSKYRNAFHDWAIQAWEEELTKREK